MHKPEKVICNAIHKLFPKYLAVYLLMRIFASKKSDYHEEDSIYIYTVGNAM